MIKTPPSFRRRVFLTTLLPILVLLPLVSLVLFSVFENQLLLPTLANEMIDQGYLVERLTLDHPEIWSSPSAAQELLNSIHFQRPSRIGLLDTGHFLLATTRPDDLVLVGKPIAHLPENNALTGSWWQITAGNTANEQILDVLVPVKNDQGDLIGLVRVYRRISDIEQSIANIRLIVLGILLLGLIITGLVALAVSESLNRPLKKLTQIISDSPLEGQAQPLPEDSDQELAALSHAYNRLQEHREELEDSRQHMIANLIHEIGRPLGSLRTALDAMKSGAVNEPELRTELLEGMVERVDRIGHLLEDLSLTYRGLEPQEIHFQKIDVNEWIGKLSSLWEENSRHKGILWQNELLPETLILDSDPNRLAQVLSNLTNNAIKFTAGGGKITLRVQKKEGNKVCFSIADTGIGIAKEDQRHLFTAFFRSVQPSWKAPGLGLGLSIAKSITESLGGEITVESVVGEGSTFSVILPIEHSAI